MGNSKKVGLPRVQVNHGKPETSRNAQGPNLGHFQVGSYRYREPHGRSIYLIEA